MGQARSTNVHWHAGELTRDERWRALGAKGATLWFTGLSGSGKSTIAAALEKTLVERGVHAYRLDGDNVRHGLNANLGFSAEDRAENIRRIGEVTRLFADSGTLAIASFISPYAADRASVRRLHEDGDLAFLEIHVHAPLSVCESRDPKGLYRKVRAGEISGFTGIDDPYEAPESPELVLRTDEGDVEDCVAACISLLEARGILPVGERSG